MKFGRKTKTRNALADPLLERLEKVGVELHDLSYVHKRLVQHAHLARVANVACRQRRNVDGDEEVEVGNVGALRLEELLDDVLALGGELLREAFARCVGARRADGVRALVGRVEGRLALLRGGEGAGG